jgi:hypothetical protein
MQKLNFSESLTGKKPDTTVGCKKEIWSTWTGITTSLALRSNCDPSRVYSRDCIKPFKKYDILRAGSNNWKVQFLHRTTYTIRTGLSGYRVSWSLEKENDLNIVWKYSEMNEQIITTTKFCLLQTNLDLSGLGRVDWLTHVSTDCK